MNENTLPFSNDDDLLQLVGQLCDCAKVKSNGGSVTLQEVKQALMSQGSRRKAFELKFELGENIPAVELTVDPFRRHVILDRYDKSFGPECKSRAYENFVSMKASIEVKNVKVEYFHGMLHDGVITRKEASK